MAIGSVAIESLTTIPLESLGELPMAQLNTDKLLANSCIMRDRPRRNATVTNADTSNSSKNNAPINNRYQRGSFRS